MTAPSPELETRGGADPTPGYCRRSSPRRKPPVAPTARRCALNSSCLLPSPHVSAHVSAHQRRGSLMPPRPELHAALVHAEVHCVHQPAVTARELVAAPHGLHPFAGSRARVSQFAPPPPGPGRWSAAAGGA